MALLLLAAALRLPALDRVPPGLHPDEAANAADALRAPLALAYAHEGGGWVEGSYVWLAAPGLRAAQGIGLPLEAAARLPAALAGIALVPALALLGTRLGGRSAGLLVGLAAACAPWALHHARLGLRASLVAPLAAWGLVQLLRAEGHASARTALGGGLLLGLAAASYPPARLVLPLLALTWAAHSWRTGGASRALILGALPPLVVLVGLLPWTLGPRGGERLHDLLAVGQGEGPLRDAWSALRGWVVHFGPRFLWSGASSRGFAPEGVGLLPRLSAPLLGLGLVALLGRRGAWRPRLLAWLVLAPLPAALTRDPPDALRATLLLPALLLLLGTGASVLLRAAPAGTWRRVLRALLAGLILAEGLGDFARYARVHAVVEARFYDAGRREAVAAVAREVASGRPLRCEDRFFGAWLRLYAPDLAVARSADGAWLVGDLRATDPPGELLLPQVSERALRPAARDRVLVPGAAWLRPP